MMPTDESGPQIPAQVEAVHPRQHEIEQHHFRMAVTDQGQHIVARVGHDDVEAPDQEIGPDEVDDVAIVLDDQDQR